MPVLSATRQSDGTPARRRFAPVVLADIHSTSRARPGSDSALPSASVRSACAIARGVEVSRGSPGVASLSVGSVRSSRVVSSPLRRRKAVTAAGPPTLASSRLAAVLSLTVTAASHSSPTLRPLPTCLPVTGAHSSRSACAMATRRSSLSWPASTRASTSAAASTLNVLHIGKRSSRRWPASAPVAVSSTATPSRPATEASIARHRSTPACPKFFCVDPLQANARATGHAPASATAPRPNCLLSMILVLPRKDSTGRTIATAERRIKHSFPAPDPR